jgi:nicotinamidase-related amidase
MLQPTRTAAATARHLVCLDLVEEAAEADQRRVDCCRRVLIFARSAGWTITHLHPKTAGSRAPRPLLGVGPLPTEPVLYRARVSAFSNRSFDRIVKEQTDAEMVILSLSLSSACLGTALYAYDLGVPVILVEDALSGSSEDLSGLEAIETVARSIVAPFVQVLRADDLIEPRRGLRLVHG